MRHGAHRQTGALTRRRQRGGAERGRRIRQMGHCRAGGTRTATTSCKCDDLYPWPRPATLFRTFLTWVLTNFFSSYILGADREITEERVRPGGLGRMAPHKGGYQEITDPQERRRRHDAGHARRSHQTSYGATQSLRTIVVIAGESGHACERRVARCGEAGDNQCEGAGAGAVASRVGCNAAALALAVLRWLVARWPGGGGVVATSDVPGAAECAGCSACALTCVCSCVCVCVCARG